MTGKVEKEGKEKKSTRNISEEGKEEREKGREGKRRDLILSHTE